MTALVDRRKYIKTCIGNFLPAVIAGLISEYDYYLKGDLSIKINHETEIECLKIFHHDEKNVKIIDALADNLEVWNLAKNSTELYDNLGDNRIIPLNSTELYDNLGDNRIILAENKFKIWSIAILPDKRVVSGSADCRLNIWNLETNNSLSTCDLTLIGHTDTIYCVNVIPDNNSYYGGCIVSGSEDATLKIWNPYTGNLELTLKGHTGGIISCIVTPDGKIVSGSRDNTLKIWNLQTKTCELTLKGHTDYIMCLAILSECNGYKIISGSCDSTIKIWNPSTLESIDTIVDYSDITLIGHSGEVYSLNVLADGRIISGSSDGTIKIWNIHDQSLKDKCEMTLNGHSSTVSCINILPDGRVISGSHDGSVIIWS